MRYLARITYPKEEPTFVTLDAKTPQAAYEVVRLSEPAVLTPTEVQVALWPMTVTRFMRPGVYAEVSHGEAIPDTAVPLREERP